MTVMDHNKNNQSLQGATNTHSHIAQVGTVTDSARNIRMLAVEFSQARAQAHKVYFSLVKTAQVGAVSDAFKTAPDYQPAHKPSSQKFSRWEWFMDFIGSIGGNQLGKIPLMAVAQIAGDTAIRIRHDIGLFDSFQAICEQRTMQAKSAVNREIFSTAKSQLDELKETVEHLHDVAQAVAAQAHRPSAPSDIA